MNETYVTIRGRLTADPTVRTTRTGAPMTTFRIAHSARRQVQGQPGQWEDTEASFYDVVTYRSLAANIAVSLRKGHPVAVHGKQRIASWQREDGSTRNSVEIEADAVGHDLTFGTTAFARVGMGRPAESWSQGEGAGLEGARSGEPGESARLGDPDSDPYVVDGAPGGDDPAEPVIDTGPLVRPGKEAAA
jgi:single-strand DNA-binding protein